MESEGKNLNLYPSVLKKTEVMVSRTRLGTKPPNLKAKGNGGEGDKTLPYS